MHIGRPARRFANGLLALMMVSGWATLAMAQGHDDHVMAGSAPHKPTRQENEVVQTVRAATEKFKDVTNVDGPDPEHYALTFGCVSGGDFGAMGMHYLKGSILHDGEINKDDPEIILFEPTRDGGIRITGADYIVFVSEWEENHKGEPPPSIDGQFFHFFEAPNRFGLDPFYTLHVWAWKENPVGTFANWNPNVSCDAFNPPPDPPAR